MRQPARSEGWEGIDAAALALRWAVPAVHLYGSIGSTNDAARTLAEEGASAGTVVLAETQRRGRGRAGRRWESPAGRGVWLSMVLRPARLPVPGLLPILIGTRLAERLERWCDTGIGVKWPNDLVVRDEKLAGILCEAAWDGARVSFVIAGVGLNVRPGAADAPGRQGIALEEVTDRPVTRTEAADALVETLATFAIRVPGEAAPDDMERFRRRDVLAGRSVTIGVEGNGGREIARGDACGVDARGRLLLRQPSGQVSAVETGTVRASGPRREESA